MKILSTKCLTSAQQQHLQSLGFTLVQHNFIATRPLSFALSLPYKWLIFTSQNGVQSVLAHPQWQELLSTPVLCVGVKTQQLLQSKGFKVCYAADYATDLVAYMRNDLSRYQGGRIAFFVGTHRLNTLPDFFAAERLQVAEITVYFVFQSFRGAELPSRSCCSGRAGVLHRHYYGAGSYSALGISNSCYRAYCRRSATDSSCITYPLMSRTRN